MKPLRIVIADDEAEIRDILKILLGGEKYKVTYTANGVEIEKNGAIEPDVIMDIPTASSLLLCGFEDAAYIPGLVIRNPDTSFLKLFPPKTSFFSDPF